MREHDFQFGLRASQDERGRQKKNQPIKGKYVLCVVVNSKRIVYLGICIMYIHTYIYT